MLIFVSQNNKQMETTLFIFGLIKFKADKAIINKIIGRLWLTNIEAQKIVITMAALGYTYITEKYTGNIEYMPDADKMDYELDNAVCLLHGRLEIGAELTDAINWLKTDIPNVIETINFLQNNKQQTI